MQERIDNRRIISLILLTEKSEADDKRFDQTRYQQNDKYSKAELIIFVPTHLRKFLMSI